MVRTLKLMDLLSFHKLKLLFLDNNVPESLLHFESVKSHFILVFSLILHRGPRTVVSLELEAQSVADRLTFLR